MWYEATEKKLSAKKYFQKFEGDTEHIDIQN